MFVRFVSVAAVFVLSAVPAMGQVSATAEFNGSVVGATPSACISA